MALTTPSYSALGELVSDVSNSPSIYNQKKLFMQKQNYEFYDIKKFMCLGSTIDNHSIMEKTVDTILVEGNQKCNKTLSDNFKIDGYKYCTTNNEDNIHFTKLFFDNYSNLFYCMHLHNDDKKCNALFKHFYQTINYDELHYKEPSKIDSIFTFTKKIYKKIV